MAEELPRYAVWANLPGCRESKPRSWPHAGSVAHHALVRHCAACVDGAAASCDAAEFAIERTCAVIFSARSKAVSAVGYRPADRRAPNPVPAPWFRLSFACHRRPV